MSYWDNIDREATKEWEHQQAFERANISEECINDIRLIKNNQPTNNDEFLLNTDDADEFTDQAWTLLGRCIANNTHLVEIDLNGCHLTDEKMSLLFRELVESCSLKVLLLNTNEFGIVGVQKMVPLLRQANLSKLFVRGNASINTECFEMLISAFDGKSIEVLDFDQCNVTDISALSTYKLPNLQRLDLVDNKIGREGCIILSKLLQKNDSKLKHLYLQCTGIVDEGAEILAAALKHNTKLQTLDLDENFITDRGGNAILKALVDVSSIESTYKSNKTLSSCDIGDNASTIACLIYSACEVNRVCSTPEGVGRAKVIKYHLNSQTLKELCRRQGIEYIPGNIFVGVEPTLLPLILSMIGKSQGQRELYRTLIHTAPDLLSYIDRKALIKNEMKMVEARGISLSEEISALITRHEREMANLNDKKADLSSRLALIDLGDMKQSAVGVDNGKKKRQRS